MKQKTHKIARIAKKNSVIIFCKGPFKYYVIKEVGGWSGQMMMFDDKVGGWGWLNGDGGNSFIFLLF